SVRSRRTNWRVPTPRASSCARCSWGWSTAWPSRSSPALQRRRGPCHDLQSPGRALGGVLVPLVLHRFPADPAISSGVFVTTVTDVVGFFSFLGIATLWFGLK